MFGGPGYSNLSPFPYYDVATETIGDHHPENLDIDTVHRVGSSPARVYLAGGAGFASAGTYSANIYFDLYHE